jgi:hypothetical protein
MSFGQVKLSAALSSRTGKYVSLPKATVLDALRSLMSSPARDYSKPLISEQRKRWTNIWAAWEAGRLPGAVIDDG